VKRPVALWVDLAVKPALLALLLVAVLFPDLPQFEGKAMTGRALTYPLAAVVVPLGWWLYGRRRSDRYPYALDILLVLPFLIDVVGNALDLYDRIDWWDDANHFVNWAFLVGAFGQLLVRLPLGPVAAVGLAIGFGALSAIVGEVAEYFAFIRDSPELATAYTDTLGDLVLGTSGSVVAALVTASLWPRLQAATI
jgi:hypothetical protein